MGIRCADHVTPLYPQKFALTSPNGGGRSVGIVRLRTKATELFGDLSLNFVRHTRYVEIVVNRLVADVPRCICYGSKKFRLKSLNCF